MKLRAKLILSFLGLAVLPLAVITLYSYNSSLRALRAAAAEESADMAADMGSRMESVSRDLNAQLLRFAAFEAQRILSLDEKEREAAMKALTGRLKEQMGDYASFLNSLQFTPAALPRFVPPPPAPPDPKSPAAAAGDRASAPPAVLFGGANVPGSGAAGSVPRPRIPPFPIGQFDTELRSGGALVGKVSAEISSRRLLFHVLQRTEPRQGEIPFARDADGQLYTTNPDDLKKIRSLPFPQAGEKSGAPQQTAAVKDWVLVTRKDAQSGLTFGIARPIGDRLGDLRRTTARNLGYGLGLVVLALAGILPLSSRMTRNLTALTKGAESLAHGDLSARVPVASKDEFGALAQAFNRMAEDLGENQKHLVEKERLHKELEMCRRIQEELLPRRPLRTGEVEIKGVSIPAREVGGDFFNYFPMPGGNMAMLIGDVSGKGLPAALLMANLQATIQARLPLELDLARLAAQLNAEIEENNAEAYLTLFLAVLDPASLTLRYVNAGHNPQFLLHGDGSAEQLPSTGRPIGLLADSRFEERSIQLRHEDALFFYTDGLVEAADAAGEEFGMARLEAMLVDERSRGPEGLMAGIETAVNRHRGGTEADDDATMMLLRIGSI